MKKIIYLSLLSVFLIGCKSYIQVFETKTTNTVSKGEFYVYENDTLKITYAFWTMKGIVSFTVYNKLDVPIYIDWKKSSYIDNSNKLNYWVDEEITKSTVYYGSYYYDGPLLKPGFSVSESSGSVTESKIKIERLTFIPPKSNYYRSQFHLLPLVFYGFDLSSESQEVIKNGTQKEKTKIYYKDFSKAESPLVFRNFLAFSLTEDFNTEFYVDNEFYLSNMKEMDYRHFKYLEKDNKGKQIYVRPFKKQTSFYLMVPKGKDIESRKKY